MFHNYFFLKRLATTLNEQLKGLRILTCFSQNRDELIIGLGDVKRTFWIRANLDPNLSLLSFPEVFHRANKNSIDLFSEILDQEIEGVQIFSYERSFQVLLTKGYALIFKMHGSRSNILLVHDEKVVTIFRKKLKQDQSLDPEMLHKTIPLSEHAFNEANHDPVALIPALGKPFRSYWNEHYSQLPEEKSWDKLQELLHAFEQGPIQLIEDGKPQLSLLPRSGYEKTEDPIYATNWLYDKTTRHYYLDHEKTQLVSQLKQKVRQSENYIFKTGEKLRVVQSQRNPEEIANLIMANLGLIQTGLTKVTLHDFYTSDFIEIKLNPKLSPQKNAENYYRKSKNRHQEEKKLKENIAQKEKLIDELSRQILEIEAIDDHKTLKKYQKAHKKEISHKKNSEPRHFHVIFFEGWQILIGKNAKANDELTLHVAKKDDLWLHAKDVSGSHVVIKQVPGQNFPPHVIEEAAGYAAFFSKRKTETYCPVIYTPKKFVRKVKGASFGQVVVEKEQVVVVAPIEPEL